MSQKNITFFIVSDRKGVVRRWVVSVRWLKLFAVFGAVIVMIGMAAFVDYMSLLAQTMENKRLKAENNQLQSQFQVVEEKVQNLESALDRVRNFTTKLRIITDTSDQDRTMKLSMGTVPNQEEGLPQSDQATDTREPASHIAKEDAVFLEKPPLELSEGELSQTTNRNYSTLAIRIDKNLKETNLREQSVLELIEFLSTRQNLLRATPSVVPARGGLTSRFGYRINPATGEATFHSGLDIGATPGTPVHVTADGVVSFAGYDEGYGKLVSVDHGYGVVTRYAHNSQIHVQIGQRIKRGDIISSTGNTGRSTGPHLHYEVRINEIPVDPINYILEQ